MESYQTGQIRNIVLLSHGGAGKTSLSEALLFDAGVINRLGRVDDGTTTSDWDPDEVKRKISTSTSVLPVPWKDHKLNVLDAPGYADFVGEMKAAVSVADAAVVVVCAASGVEVGTEIVWQYIDQAQLPRLIFMNKMDRENADFYRSLAEVQQRFGAQCVSLCLPVGSVASFSGVVDLLSQKAFLGVDGSEAPIPSDMQEVAAAHREKLVEVVAETDDDLLAKYLEGEEISEEELRAALRTSIIQGKVVPILAGSALQNIGMKNLVNTLIDLTPSPTERPPVTAHNPQTNKDEDISADPGGPLAAFVFKSTADPYIGKLTYFRVFSGTLKSDSQVWDVGKGKPERLGQLLAIRGKAQEPVQQVVAGDIGAVAKLTDVNTGDTLTTREHPLALPPISFPEPLYRLAVFPKTKADLDKLANALSRLVEEDPTLSVYKDPDTAETIMAGVGDSHLEITVDRMKRKFGVEVTMGVPRVSYKETITMSTKAEYKHKKQTGGHGQYGHVVLELEPLSRGSGFEFAEKVVGGSVPRNYIPAVEKGVNTAVHEGALARFPLVDVRVTLFDGSYHPVDSSDMSFQIAASQAVKQGVLKANPVLLEPIMDLHVTVPEGQTGDIMSDLNTKRARVLGMTPNSNGYTTIEAQAPLAEVQQYATDLRSLTQGRGSFKMEFNHYDEVPPHLLAKVVEQVKKDREAAEKA